MKPTTYLTIDAIRRANLAKAIAIAGSQAKLAAKLGKAPAQVSQWMNASPDSKTGRPRTMSDDVCLEVETAVGKPEGWMDNVHPGASQDEYSPMSEGVHAAAAAPLALALPAVLDALAAIPALRWPAVREMLGQVVGHPEMRDDIAAELAPLLAPSTASRQRPAA